MCHWRAFGQSTPWFQALQKAKAKGFSTQWMDSFWWQIGLPKRPIVMFPKAWMLMLANVPPDRLLAWEMSPRCGGEGFGSWAKGWCLSLTGIRCVEVLVQDAMMMIGSCIILICCNSPRQNMNACCLFFRISRRVACLAAKPQTVRVDCHRWLWRFWRTGHLPIQVDIPENKTLLVWPYALIYILSGDSLQHRPYAW